SLKRMHREALDLVQFHWWDYNVPGMLETAFDLVKLQEKGKIRNIGMCNMDTEALKLFVDAGIPVVSNQAQYSMFDRRPERTLLDYSAEHGIYTFAYGTLAGGFLAERYMGKAYEAPETRSQVKYMQIIEDSLGWEGMQKLLPVLKEIAEHHNVTIPNVATQYVLNQKSVGAVMVGTRNSRHVASNLSTLSFDLTAEEMQTIRDFIAQYPTPDGECYELERTSPRYKGIILTDRNEAGN
ncbi:MAG: aldo/keto reductase, partial [Lachnospiraceae bacterium]|nr:aldo/keto reductase [Lachnospiraceae bacterium]